MNERIVDSVDAARWREAQAWEGNHWVRVERLRGRWFKNHVWRLLSTLGLKPRYRGDDWNHWWHEAFDGYSFLPTRVRRGIEVGCGPYTNIRLIRDRTQIDELVLSDPLIQTYAQFEQTFVGQMHRSSGAHLDDHPLEQLPFRDASFDLTVMINVLDHVQDARLCMAEALRITATGGWLVLGQDLSNDEDIAKMEGGAGEVGHPIKLDAEWFEPYLASGFDHVIRRVLPREDGRNPPFHVGTLLFAGRKVG